MFRQAGALLVAIVVLLGVFHFRGKFFHPLSWGSSDHLFEINNRSTKASISEPLKSIEIFHYAININSLLLSDQNIDISSQNIGGIAIEALAGTDSHFSHTYPVGRALDLETGRQWVGPYFNFGRMANVISRSLPGVDYRIIDFEFSVIDGEHYARNFDDYVGAQLPFGGLLGSSYKIARRLPQKASSNRQNNSECGDKDCTEGNDKFLIVLYLFLVFGPAIGLLIFISGHTLIASLVWGGLVDP